MKAHEFYFAALDTRVLVENHFAHVIIRASRDTLSESRKLFFIRELAAEGFIADDDFWLLLGGSEQERGVRWVVDDSWLRPDSEAIAQSRQWITHLVCWTCVLGAVTLISFLLPLTP